MGAQDLLLMDIFRILTPEEIRDLTSSYSGETKVPLTDLLEMKIDGKELDFSDGAAKILPFKKKRDESLNKKVGPCVSGKIVQEFIDRFFIRKKRKSTAMDEHGNAVETSSFIMSEKKRFEYSQEKLKGKEILSLYEKNAKVDIQQEKLIKSDMSKSSRVGILINKKQF